MRATEKERSTMKPKDISDRCLDILCDLNGIISIMKVWSGALTDDNSEYCCIPGVLISALEQVSDKVDKIGMSTLREVKSE